MVFCYRQILEELTELPVMVDLASDFLDRGTPIFRWDPDFNMILGVLETIATFVKIWGRDVSDLESPDLSGMMCASWSHSLERLQTPFWHWDIVKRSASEFWQEININIFQAGALTLGVTNTVGSTISRETHCGIHVNAGPEIGIKLVLWANYAGTIFNIQAWQAQKRTLHNFWRSSCSRWWWVRTAWAWCRGGGRWHHWWWW